MLPPSVSGALPAPAVVTAVPTLESAGQLPLFAASPRQSPMPFTPPTRPAGSDSSSPLRICSPGARAMLIVTCGLAPAARFDDAALNVGAKALLQAAPLPSALVVNDDVGVAFAVPLNGVRLA